MSTVKESAKVSTEVAQEIVNNMIMQLGNSFFAMTGCNFKYYHRKDNGHVELVLSVGKHSSSKVKFMRLTYYYDAYDLKFTYIKKKLNKEKSFPGFRIYDETEVAVKEYKGICADIIKPLFKEVTGLDTHL